MEMNSEEKALWQRLAKIKRAELREEIRNQLTERYLWLVTRVVDGYSRRLPAHVCREDMYSEAAMGLMDGIERFSLRHNTSPSTFLRFRISGRVVDWLRKADTISRLHRGRLNKLAIHEEQLGQSLSSEECKATLGFDRPPTAPTTLSIFRPICRDDEGRTKTLADELSESQPKSRSLQDCRYLLKSLSGQERLIVLLYHVEGLTMKQVAKEVGLSESRISQIMTGLLVRLKDNAIRSQAA